MKIWTLPNILTCLRIVLIPVFILVYYLPWHMAHQAAAGLFVLAAVTDWFDGYLARKMGQFTAFGAFLDPVADKLMVAAALILLVSQFPTVWLVVPGIVIVSREIVISALREWMAELGERAVVKVSMIGKIKTTMQMVALIVLLWQSSDVMSTMAIVGLVLMYVAAVLTLWSMILYLLAAWRVIWRVESGA